jgi:hypothetical protein
MEFFFFFEMTENDLQFFGRHSTTINVKFYGYFDECPTIYKEKA